MTVFDRKPKKVFQSFIRAAAIKGEVSAVHLSVGFLNQRNPEEMRTAAASKVRDFLAIWHLLAWDSVINYNIVRLAALVEPEDI